MRRASPPQQRLSPDLIRATISSGDRRLFVAEDDAGAVTAFALVLPLGSSTVLLEYMAVDEAQRSCGIGSCLFTSLCAAEIDAGARAVFLEIDDPDEPGLIDDSRTERTRRATFDRRNAAHPVPAAIRYTPPSLSGDRPAPSLLLLAFTGGAAVSFQDAAIVLAAIANRSYGPPTA